jgi:hypothetical protein
MIDWTQTSSEYWNAVGDLGSKIVWYGVFGEILDFVLKRSERHFEERKQERKPQTKCSVFFIQHKHFIDDLGIVFWALVVAGLMVDEKGTNMAREIEERDNAVMHKIASDNELKAVELEKELTGIDPAKQPIASMRFLLRMDIELPRRTNDLDVVSQITQPADIAGSLTFRNGEFPVFIADKYDLLPQDGSPFPSSMIVLMRFNPLPPNIEGAFPDRRVDDIDSINRFILNLGLKFPPNTEFKEGWLYVIANTTIKSFKIPRQRLTDMPEIPIPSLYAPELPK